MLINLQLRLLGVHISRVKSVNLDTWAPEQVVSLQQMGNSRARAVYEALLSDNFRRPQTDQGLETLIRAKYEHKKYIAREWIPPPPITKVDWDKEIEEELENQKRKKKSSSATISEPVKSAPSPINVALPAPLPKPHSPKNSRLEAKKVVTTSTNSMDLLGLNTSSSSATSTASPVPANIPTAVSTIGDGFDFFANVSTTPANVPAQQTSNGTLKNNPVESSLKQEEDDFFNQKSLENGSVDKGKMTKDSILALYAAAPSFTPQQQSFNANFQQFPGVPQDQFFTYGQQPGAPLFKPIPQPQHFAPNQPMMLNNNGNFGNFNANFGTMQTQQINKLNEENIKKIESLNFNSFK